MRPGRRHFDASPAGPQPQEKTMPHDPQDDEPLDIDALYTDDGEPVGHTA